jgi:hypothetical protein
MSNMSNISTESIKKISKKYTNLSIKHMLSDFLPIDTTNIIFEYMHLSYKELHLKNNKLQSDLYDFLLIYYTLRELWVIHNNDVRNFVQDDDVLMVFSYLQNLIFKFDNSVVKNIVVSFIKDENIVNIETFNKIYVDKIYFVEQSSYLETFSIISDMNEDKFTLDGELPQHGTMGIRLNVMNDAIRAISN